MNRSGGVWPAIVVVACGGAAAGCGRIDFGAATDGGGGGGGGDAAVDDGTYAGGVRASRPVGYWRLDEGAGAPTAIDVAGGNDGAYQGGIVHGDGVIAGDGAATFDGSDTAVVVPDVLPFAGTAAFSIELWVRPVVGDMYQHFLTKEPRITGVPQDGYAMLSTASGVFLERVVGANGAMYSAIVPIPSGMWSHVVGTYDGTLLSLYVNGAYQPGGATDARPMTAYTTPIYFGRHSEGAFLTGDLDEIAIYDRALPDAEIAQHYTRGLAGR